MKTHYLKKEIKYLRRHRLLSVVIRIAPKQKALLQFLIHEGCKFRDYKILKIKKELMNFIQPKYRDMSRFNSSEYVTIRPYYITCIQHQMITNTKLDKFFMRHKVVMSVQYV